MNDEELAHLREHVDAGSEFGSSVVRRLLDHIAWLQAQNTQANRIIDQNTQVMETQRARLENLYRELEHWRSAAFAAATRRTQPRRVAAGFREGLTRRVE
jgi:uncharacterized coiled-coil protein SlyX